MYDDQILSHVRSSVSEVKTDGGLQSQLTISQSDRQDSGLYICQAGNVFGHSELLVHLAVQGKTVQVANLTCSQNINFSRWQ